jgi:hypothetical protein
MATEDGPCLDAILGAKGRDRGLLLRFEALRFRRTSPLDCPPLCFHVPGRSRQPRKFRTRPADRAFHRAGLAGHVRVSTISDMRRCRRGFGMRDGPSTRVGRSRESAGATFFMRSGPGIGQSAPRPCRWNYGWRLRIADTLWIGSRLIRRDPEEWESHLAELHGRFSRIARRGTILVRPVGCGGNLGDIKSEYLESQCIPTDCSLWRIKQAEPFFAARRKLLAESFNKYLRDALQGRRL